MPMPMSNAATPYTRIEDAVEDTLARVGKRIRLGTPLGLGKANHLVNEFYRRATEDSRIDLHIYTALSLAAPTWKNDLERRFIEPLAERLFGGYPELEYVVALKRGRLPENIRVTEFYVLPGAYLNTPEAQQRYISSNYSHAVRDIVDAGINVIAQAVGCEERDGQKRYSLSCNTDLTLDLVPILERQRRHGREIALLAQVNPNLPFMYGDAEVGSEYFDGIVDHQDYYFRLFGVPNRPVSTEDYLLALHVSTLVRDGSTLQIGIGSLGDAICELLRLRHVNNDAYQQAVRDAWIPKRFGPVVERLGGTNSFERGLYASSEMLVAGFLELYRGGILRRKVFNHAGLQRLLNDGRIGEAVTGETLQALVEDTVVSADLTAADFEFLQRFGVFRPEVSFADGMLRLEDGTMIPATLANEQAVEQITSRCLGEELRGGHVAHACFFLGPEKFYEGLRDMPPAERQLICMTGISYVNELYGPDEELKRVQRKDARFINGGLIATLSGAVASDGLEDGRVLSGVGGQYNFVAMAHALQDGRSILMIRSVREEGGKPTSNIRFNYGHVTIPRHLRDIVVTEYGIAELRGKSDAEVAAALIEVADTRFQGVLVEQAKKASKLPDDYEIPEHARHNTPERLEKVLVPFRERALFDRFPFGADLTDEEITLKKALTALKQTLTLEQLILPGPNVLRDLIDIPDSARPYLQRMDLANPQNAKETLMQRAVIFGLSAIRAI